MASSREYCTKPIRLAKTNGIFADTMQTVKICGFSTFNTKWPKTRLGDRAARLAPYRANSISRFIKFYVINFSKGDEKSQLWPVGRLLLLLRTISDNAIERIFRLNLCENFEENFPRKDPSSARPLRMFDLNTNFQNLFTYNMYTIQDSNLLTTHVYKNQFL